MYGVEIPECFDGHRAVRALMELPPIQPDLSEYSDKLWRNAHERGKAEAQDEIVRCKDCEHFKRNIPCVGGFYDGCDELIDDGNEMPVDENFYCGYAERRTDGKN